MDAAYKLTDADKRRYQRYLKATGGDEGSAMDLLLRWKCLSDLYFLGAHVLGLAAAREGKRARLDPHFHGWLAHVLQSPRDTMVMVPRDHMKSTWTKIRIIQMVLQRPNIRIGLFSRTSGLVEAQLADIRTMLQTPLLMRLFPEIIPPPGKRCVNWVRATANELTTRRDSTWGRIPQENQIEAWGAGATVTGRHYDVIVMDDILNEQSCSTPEQLQKVLDWYGYIQSIKEPGGWEYVIGTRYHFSDLYGAIIKNQWFKDRVYIRSAIEDGQPIYNFFTLAYLQELKRRQGAFKFSCQYMNNPLPEEDKIFPSPQPIYFALPKGRFMRIITLDPAPTVNQRSDYTALVVGSFDMDNAVLYIEEAIQLKAEPADVADILVSKIIQYRPEVVGIEYGLQAALKWIVDVKLDEAEKIHGRRAVTTKIEAITIPRNLSKAERVKQSCAGLARDGHLFVHESCKDLLSQMDFFPKGEHDDLVDAMAMQLQLINRFVGAGAKNVVQRAGKTFFDLFRKPDTSGAWDYGMIQ